jgi:hypothetical protein
LLDPLATKSETHESKIYVAPHVLSEMGSAWQRQACLLAGPSPQPLNLVGIDNKAGV